MNASFSSVLHMLLLISQVQDADDAQDLQLTAGQVEFDSVSFSYVPGCVANISIVTVVSLCFYSKPIAALNGSAMFLLF